MCIEPYNEHLDCALDEALKGTFPASDPISISACHSEQAKVASTPSKQKKEKRRSRGGR